MPVSFVSAAVPSANNLTTSFTITIPTVQVGDVLVVEAISRDHTAGTGLATCTDDDTGGNTWTNEGNTTDRKAYVFRKIATSATSGKTITFAGAVGSCSGVLKVFRGSDQTTPITNLAFETNASGDESHATFTPTNSNSMYCCGIYNYANDNAVTSLSFATAGATTMTEKLSTGGLDSAVAFGHVGPGSGASGALTWAQTNGTTYSVVFAISPPPAVSGTAAPTVTPLTAAASGNSADVQGDGAATLQPLTAAAAGSEKFTGAGAPTLAPITASAQGSEKFTGAAASTLAPVRADGSGVSVDVLGEGASILAPVTASGEGASASAEPENVRLLGGFPREAVVVDEWGSPELGGSPYKTEDGRHKIDLVSEGDTTPESPHKNRVGSHKATIDLVPADEGGRNLTYKTAKGTNRAEEA